MCFWNDTYASDAIVILKVKMSDSSDLDTVSLLCMRLHKKQHQGLWEVAFISALVVTTDPPRGRPKPPYLTNNMRGGLIAACSKDMQSDTLE